MKNYIEPIARLIGVFQKLPGVGQKTAQRYAYKILDMTSAQVTEFANTLISTKNSVNFCKICGNFTENEICKICNNENRDKSIICVVKEAKEILAIEKINEFNGVYHVLGGLLNPIDNVGPNDLRIKELISRLNSSVKEVIIATSPTVEGEATAMYLARLIKPLGIKTTRLAQGVSAGSELEYTDNATLAQAIENRLEI